MLRRFLASLLILTLGLGLRSQAVWAQSEASPSLKFWVFLKDKPPASTQRRPSASLHALHRRASRGGSKTHVWCAPLSPGYLTALKRRGVRPIVKSRWLNAVSARLTPEALAAVQALPFVQSVRPVGHIETARKAPPATAAEPKAALPSMSLDYGPSRYQLDFINAIPPLERGIDGTGVRLGFLDTEFGGFKHPVFGKLVAEDRLLAVKNFTNGSQGNRHALSVASLAVGFAPGDLVGPGHGASVLAATTEYAPSETGQEEDFFVAGLEWLEQNGADVVNVSLGYTTFPDDSSYAGYDAPDDLDGDTGVTTRAVDRAAALGVVMVIAAGNEGCSNPDDCWYYIDTPADADSAIAVGAATPDSARSSFSSFGPTADGRHKPDVAALGSIARKKGAVEGPYVAVSSGYGRGNGTSFAAPQVAGVVCQVLQANPELNPIEVRRILHQTASRADHPNNRLGWGIVNAAEAVRRAEDIGSGTVPPHGRASLSVRPPYPNPAVHQITLEVRAPAPAERLRLVIYDALGRRIATRRWHGLRRRSISLDVQTWPAGSYFYRVTAQSAASAEGTFVIAR